MKSKEIIVFLSLVDRDSGKTH